MKNQVIEVLTEEHGKQVIEYWESQGVDTRGLSGGFCKANDGKFRYYGVINGFFWYYSIEKVKAANAEIIELPEKEELYFEVPTLDLSRAVQRRLLDLGYNYIFSVDIIDTPRLRYIYVKNDGTLSWSSDKSFENRRKGLEKGSFDDLFYTDKYKYTPTKKVIELTMQEIAEKFGVDEVKIKH